MKRFFSVLALLVFLCSCGTETDSAELLGRFTAEVKTPGSCIVYLSGAASGEHFLDDEKMGLIYPDGTDIRILCSDYAILIGMGSEPYEIHLLHARSRSDMPDLLSALTARRQLLQQRKNETFTESMREAVQSARVYPDGSYAILIVSRGAESAEGILRGLF